MGFESLITIKVHPVMTIIDGVIMICRIMRTVCGSLVNASDLIEVKILVDSCIK
jgi:hypothetical protein